MDPSQYLGDKEVPRPHVYKKMPSQSFSVSANFTSASQNSHRSRVAPCFDKLFMQPMLAYRLLPVYDHAVTRVLQKLHARSSRAGFHQRIHTHREKLRCSAASECNSSSSGLGARRDEFRFSQSCTALLSEISPKQSSSGCRVFS